MLVGLIQLDLLAGDEYDGGVSCFRMPRRCRMLWSCRLGPRVGWWQGSPACSTQTTTRCATGESGCKPQRRHSADEQQSIELRSITGSAAEAHAFISKTGVSTGGDWGSPVRVDTCVFRNASCRLDRLQQLAMPVRRWNRELLAMSPPALARCISASDAAIARLQALSDIGSANSRRLPPINKILTMPAQYWAVLSAEVAAARGRAADNWADTAAAAGGGAAAAAAAGSEEEEEGVGVVAGRGTTRAQAAARAAANTAARGASALAEGRSVAPAAAAPTASSSQSLEEGDGIMESEAAGLLGGDASWRSSLTTAILGAAADMKAQWLGSKGEEGGEEAGKEAAATGSSRYRRRR